MRVDASALDAELREILTGWGWTLAAEQADAILSAAGGGVVAIRTGASAFPDDMVFLPLRKDELEARIEAAKARRARLAKRLHDLRSPLNAIQGYAEMIAEIAEGDAIRFASNIRTASELLTNRLETLREEGV